MGRDSLSNVRALKKDKSRSRFAAEYPLDIHPKLNSSVEHLSHQEENTDQVRNNDSHLSQSQKLHRLPQGACIKKRPILRPPIASIYAGRQTQKVVYISSKTPFISAVKRARKILDQIEKRSMGKVSLLGKGRDREKLAQTSVADKGEPEEVVLKATGKAIEKAMGLALFFQTQEDCRVRIRTGSVTVVDDIEEARKSSQNLAKASATESVARQKRKRSNDDLVMAGTKASDAGNQIEGESKTPDSEHDAEEIGEDLPETQMRRISMIEIAIAHVLG